MLGYKSRKSLFFENAYLIKNLFKYSLSSAFKKHIFSSMALVEIVFQMFHFRMLNSDVKMCICK